MLLYCMCKMCLCVGQQYVFKWRAQKKKEHASCANMKIGESAHFFSLACYLPFLYFDFFFGPLFLCILTPNQPCIYYYIEFIFYQKYKTLFDKSIFMCMEISIFYDILWSNNNNEKIISNSRILIFEKVKVKQ